MSSRLQRFVDNQSTLSMFIQNSDFRHAKTGARTPMKEVLRLLDEERENNELYFDFWEMAEDEIEERGLIRGKKKIPVECFIAIYAYTLDTNDGSEDQLYLDFNNACRKLERTGSWSNFKYKSLYCLLLKSISGVQSNPDPTSRLIYRGVRGKDDIIPNDEICYNFNQFTSFSTKRKTAEDFLQGYGTLIIYEPPPMAAYGIKNYSAVPDEDEVLVFPWNTFTIKEIDRRGPIHHIYIKSKGPHSSALPYTH